jgi:NDP-sugar pyrophosphorylase family protein
MSDTGIRKAVILAGGLGARLRPLTNVIPKPLLPIGESTVLEVQILGLKKFGVEEVFIATNYMSEYIAGVLGTGERYGIRVSVSREDQPLGTCGPVLLLRDHLTEPFYLMNGDIITSIDFAALSRFALGIAADLVVVTKDINIPFRFGKVEAVDGFITAIEEKPTYKQEILAGIYVLKPPVFDLVPEKTYYGIDQLIKDMLRRRRPVAKYLMQEYWIDIGQLDDYEMAKATYRPDWKGLDG